MSPADDNSPPSLLPVRAESLHPSTDWPSTWTLARTKGLGSELTALLFRLLHQLLPTQDRVQRIVGAAQEHPGRCQQCQLEVEDLLHAFFLCQKSMVAGHALLGYVQHCVPGLSPEEALRLELGQNLEDADQLATVCVLATGLMYIWTTRTKKKVITLYKMRAEIEAKITILRKTRYWASGLKMLEMIN